MESSAEIYKTENLDNFDISFSMSDDSKYICDLELHESQTHQMSNIVNRSATECFGTVDNSQFECVLPNTL